MADGFKFDSERERDAYLILSARERADNISGLELQRPFALVVNNIHVCDYVADFVYFDKNGDRVVADAKGMRTPLYALKKKLMRACLGIVIVEM